MWPSLAQAILAQAISLKRHVAHARYRRVLVIFWIERWLACVRHGPVAISFFACAPSLGLLQVMSQPRRSARLAARFQQSASSLPVEIDLTDPDGFSDGMSEDLASFSDNVPLPPASSCFVCDGHFASSGPLSRCVLQCWSLSIHLQCVTDLVHESSQSVVCPACNSQSPSSLDFLHFQHVCCVHHVEALQASA